MNYQNNIDAYYAYAKENHKRRKKEERAAWLWLLASILVLFGIWFYFNNLNLLNGLGSSEDERSQNKLSKVVLANDTTQKSHSEVAKTVKISKNSEMSKKDSTKNESSIKSVEVNKKVEGNPKIEKKVAQQKSSFELASKREIKSQKNIKSQKDINTKEDSNKITKTNFALANVTKKSIPKPQEQVNIVPVAVVNGKDSNSAVKEPIAMGLTKKSDINGSVKEDGNCSVALVERQEINSSLKESTSKLGTVTVVEDNSSIDLYHIYVVSKGESIYDIARKEYGDTQMYIKIVKANPELTNPNKIREGQELYLPIVDESKTYSSILHFK
jgi:nucleoid-associated protein YgaU